MYNAISGETITYTYDSLNRLSTASDSIEGTLQWTEGYGFDSFGNLFSKNLTAGSGAPNASWVVNTATNQTGSVDANGNTLSSYYGTQEYSLGYDTENRVAGVANINGNPFSLSYAYDGQNRRIFSWNGSEDSLSNPINYTVNVYTPSGQKLAAYTLSPSLNTCGSSPCMEVALASSDQYFGGRRVAAMDQLGSAESPHQSYFPWGEPKGTSNPQDTWNFATYWTDSATGLDYANNRYYSNAYGRFMTPDPYQASGGPGDPQSWNRYAYTRGDPVNRFDPAGTCDLGISFWGDDTPYTDCDASLGPDFNPAAYAQCMATPGCYTPLPGGGNPSAAVHLTPLIAPTTQNQQQALDAGIDSAWAHIISNPGCAAFLTGNSALYNVQLLQLAGTLDNTTYTFAALTGQDSNAAATTNEIGGNQVTINTSSSGAFFTSPNGNGSVTVFGPNSQGQTTPFTFNGLVTLDAAILLHELGHETGVLGPDGAAAQNGLNQAQVLSNCFTKNAQGVYQ